MEIWKDIEGYEGIYKVSSFGRVKSLERVLSDGRKWNEKIMKPVNDKDGYHTTVLYKEGKRKSFKIHRLVALTFIPNLEGKEQVNHKDMNVSNNHVDNLEWCTPSENIQHAWSSGKREHMRDIARTTALETNRVRWAN